MSRRRWLRDLAIAILGLAMTAWGQAPSKSDSRGRPGEADVIDKVEAQAKKAGLGAVGQSRSPHFLGLGDAPAAFREEALEKICETLGKDFLTYFGRRGFKVAYPDRRLTVVALKDTDAFKAYIEANPAEEVAGQYELDSNQLIMFDLRDLQGKLNKDAKLINTFALVHETIHLICFNTGLLSRDADVPRVISEGLATYGELWTPPHNAKVFGATNSLRLKAITQAGDWIPIAELLTKDDLFDKPETSQLAYGEAWLLVHYLLREPQLRKTQAYLSGMPKLGATKSRVEYAEGHLGSLKALDQEVRRHGKRLIRK